MEIDKADMRDREREGHAKAASKQGRQRQAASQRTRKFGSSKAG